MKVEFSPGEGVLRVIDDPVGIVGYARRKNNRAPSWVVNPLEQSGTTREEIRAPGYEAWVRDMPVDQGEAVDVEVEELVRGAVDQQAFYVLLEMGHMYLRAAIDHEKGVPTLMRDHLEVYERMYHAAHEESARRGWHECEGDHG